MATLTYLELCQKLREDQGLSGSGPGAVTSQTGLNKKIVNWVADADEYIQRKWEDWTFLFVPKVVITALAGTATFTPAELGVTNIARWVETKFASHPGTDNFKRLECDLDYDMYLESSEYLGATESGDPDRIIINPTNNAITFYPVQTTNTTVWGAYYKEVTRMVANGSISAIPSRFQEAILYKAAMSYATFMENGALYDEMEEQFDEIMLKLEANQIPGFKGSQTGSDDNYKDIIVY